METLGEDGSVKSAIKIINLAGIRSVSFKALTKEGFAYDFLWRVYQKIPASGESLAI